MNSDDRKIKSNGKIELESSGDIELDSSSKIAVSGDIEMAGGKELRIKDGSGNKTTIKTGSQSGDLDFVLPTSAGVSGQVLKTNGSGTLSWAYSGGSGGGGGLDSVLSETYEEDIDSADFTTGNGTLAYTASGTINGAISNETTSGKVIAGDKSLKYIAGSSAANDYFLSQAITLDNMAKGKTASISFYYTWGGSHDTDIECVVISSDGDVLTSSSDTLEATSTIKKFSTTFSIPVGATAVKYGFKVADAATSEELIVDQVVLTLDPFVSADLGTITDWVKFTPSFPDNSPGDGSTPGQALSASDGLSGVDAYWRRVGSNMEINIAVECAYTVAPPNLHTRIAIPGGYQIADQDKGIQIGRSVLGRVITTQKNSSHGPAGTSSSGERVSPYGDYAPISIIAEPDSMVGSSDKSNRCLLMVDSTKSTTTDFADDKYNSLQIHQNWGFKVMASVPIKGWTSTNTHIVTPAKSNLTNWKSYSLSTKLNSNQGVYSNGTLGQYRRVGDSIEVKFGVQMDDAGNSSVFTVALPDGLTFDTSKLPNLDGDGAGYLGSCTWYNAGTGTSDMQVGYYSSTTIKVFGDHREIVSGHGAGVGDESTNALNSDRLYTNDYISGTFTAPIAEWSAEDHNFLAALPMTKYQHKYLDQDYDGTDTTGADIHNKLKFENLAIGKVYRLTLHYSIDMHNNASDGLGIYAYDGSGSTTAIMQHLLTDINNPKELRGSVSAVFKSVNGSVHWSVDNYGTSDIIKGSGNKGDTYVTLEELPMHQETDIW